MFIIIVSVVIFLLSFKCACFHRYLNYFLESGFMSRNLGCISDNPGSRDGVVVSRHQCARDCLASADCVRFEYHYNLSPAICKMYSDTCTDMVIQDVHTYDKG